MSCHCERTVMKNLSWMCLIQSLKERTKTFLLEICLCTLKMRMWLRDEKMGWSSCKTLHIKCKMEILKGVREEKCRKVTRPDWINYEEILRCDMDIMGKRMSCSLLNCSREKGRLSKSWNGCQGHKSNKKHKLSKSWEARGKRGKLFHHFIIFPVTWLCSICHGQVLRLHLVKHDLLVVSGQ